MILNLRKQQKILHSYLNRETDSLLFKIHSFKKLFNILLRDQAKKFKEKELLINRDQVELIRRMKLNQCEVYRKNLYHKKYIEDILIKKQLKSIIDTNQKKKRIIKHSLDNIELINNNNITN